MYSPNKVAELIQRLEKLVFNNALYEFLQWLAMFGGFILSRALQELETHL